MTAALGRARRAAVALGLFVGSCSAFEEDIGPVACPEVLIIADAATVNEYREGPGRDLTDIRFAAQLVDTAWACAYDEDGIVDVEITIAMAAQRGPVADDRTASFAYFVAVAGVDRDILAKQVFPFEITFEGNVDSVAFQRIVGTRFYVGDDTTGSHHRIYIGFQLTEDQLGENRRARPGG